MSEDTEQPIEPAKKAASKKTEFVPPTIEPVKVSPKPNVAQSAIVDDSYDSVSRQLAANLFQKLIVDEFEDFNAGSGQQKLLEVESKIKSVAAKVRRYVKGFTDHFGHN